MRIVREPLKESKEYPRIRSAATRSVSSAHIGSARPLKPKGRCLHHAASRRAACRDEQRRYDDRNLWPIISFLRRRRKNLLSSERLAACLRSCF
jgi:hypothetical protein